MEHVQGTQWWTDYQPVSYILTSKRGDRAQYANMITTCHAAGVNVIAGAADHLVYLLIRTADTDERSRLP